jgi:hypothetical protein
MLGSVPAYRSVCTDSWGSKSPILFKKLNSNSNSCSYKDSYYSNPVVVRVRRFSNMHLPWELFVGPGYQGNDIVFRFIIEYRSFRDFIPYVIIIGLFLYEDFLKISHRVMISWRILVSFKGFFLKIMVKYLNFHNSSFALRYFLI